MTLGILSRPGVLLSTATGRVLDAVSIPAPPPPPPTPGGGGTVPGGPADAAVIVLQGAGNALQMDNETTGGGFGTLLGPLVAALTSTPNVYCLADPPNAALANDPVAQAASGYSVVTAGGTFLSAAPGDPTLLLNPNGSGATANNPATWPLGRNGTALMNYAANFVMQRSALGVPVCLVRYHSEADSADTSTSMTQFYSAANLRLVGLWRAAFTGKSIDELPIFYGAPHATAGVQQVGADNIRAGWRSHIVDSSSNAHWAFGNVYDVRPRSATGDLGDQAADRLAAARMAIRIARWMSDEGYSHTNLSWLAGLGPRVVRVQRVAGAPNKLDWIVVHDRGSALIVPGASGTSTESANGSQITAAGQPAIVNSFGEAWTLVNGGATLGLQVAVNGVVDQTTQQVQRLLYSDHILYQQTTSGLWFGKSRASDTWTSYPAAPTVTPTVNTQINLAAFRILDKGAQIPVTAVESPGPTTLRLTLASAPTGTDAQVISDYCADNGFYAPTGSATGGLVTDNWHTLTTTTSQPGWSAIQQYYPGLQMPLAKFDAPLQIGVTIALSDIPTGAGGTPTPEPPPPPAGTTPVRARAFTSTLGVQTQLGLNAAGGFPSSSYGTYSLVQSALDFLNPAGVGSGISVVRDTIARADLFAFRQSIDRLGSLGYRFLFYHGYDNSSANYTSQYTAITSVVTNGIVWGIEGPNDVDAPTVGLINLSSGVILESTSTTYTSWNAAAAAQTNLKTRFLAGGLPLVMFSATNTANEAVGGPIPTAMTTLGQTVAGASTHNNVRFFQTGGHAPASTGGQLSQFITLKTALAPAHPYVITGAGFNDVSPPQGGYFGTQAINAVYTLNLILDAYTSSAALTTIFELFDANTGASGASAYTDHWGLFDALNQPKQSAIALRNLMAVLGDAAANAATFTVAPLNVVVTGLPAGTQQLLLQKSTGAYELIIWKDLDLFPDGTVVSPPAASNVTVTLDNPAGQISVYDPLVIPALPPPPVSVPAPTGLVTSAITASSITVSWNAVSGTGVTYIPQSAPQGSTTFTSLTETPSTSATFTGLAGSTAYQFRVVAISSGVQSVPSSTVTATTGVPTPTGLTTSAITANSVTLSWNAIPGTGVTYIPQSAPQGSATFTSLPASSATSATFTGLTATATYQFRVIAVINAVQSVPSSIVTATTAVPTVTGLTTSSITSSSVTLTWNAVAGTGVTYIPQAAPQGSTVFTSLAATASTTATFTGLTSSAVYQFRVITVINGTQSTPSAVVNATTAAFVVPAPTGLTTSGITSTAVTLNWSAVSAPSPTYIPQYATSGSGTYTALATTASTTATFTSLAASTAYDFRVIAVSGTTQSAPSSIVTATTSAAVVPAPTGLSTSAITATSVTLSWSAVTGTGITYIPQFALQGSTTFTSLTAVSATTANFTGLASNTAYQFRVIAVDSIGTQSSPSAVATATTLVTPVSAPTGLTASGITATSITLNWSAVAGTGITYIPQIAPQGSSTFTPLPATASLSATFTGLVASTTYQLRVIAVNNVGTQSNPSTAITASTIASAVPTPTGLVTSGITSSAVTLSWNAVAQPAGESANGTQVTAAGQPGITNSVGEVWTLVDGGAGIGLQIAVNGVADTNTLQVQKLVYDNHLVWQQNIDGLWWSKSQSSDAWTPTSGTSTAPASANSPPVTYIPQRAPQSSTTWTSLASTGATSATFTGLTANTTYQFRVIAVIGGVQSTPATAVTAKTLANAPAGNTPVRKRTADLIDTMGVNMHIAWVDTVYGTADLVGTMNYLGIKHVRDGVPYEGFTLDTFVALANTGVKFTCLVDANAFAATESFQDDIGHMTSLVNAVPGSLAGVEGFNEINLFPVSYQGQTTQSNLSIGRTLQQMLYQQVKSSALSSVPVLNLTIASPLTVSDAIAAMGDLGPYCDQSTWHTYYGSGDQPVANLTNESASARTLGGGKPAQITETGYYTAVDDLSWGGGGVTEPVQAKLILNIYMVSADLNNTRAFIYELFDDGTAPPTAIEGSFGLFHNDTSPKQSGTAIHNFTTILADTGSTAKTFTTVAATLNISGLPSSGKTFLTQKSNGTYMLILWATPRVWNQPTRTAVSNANTNVTITLGATVSVIRVYDPLVGTSAVQTVNNTNVVVAGVSDHPIVVEFPSV